MAQQPYWAHSFRTSDQSRPAPRSSASAGDPCQGPCNSQWRKAQAALDAYQEAVKAWQDSPFGPPPPEPQIPAGLSPWPGDPVFCPKCTGRYRQLLAELADLAAIADAENTGHRRGPDAQRVSGSKHAPSPSPVCDNLDELASVLRGWEAVALGGDTAARAGHLLPEIGTVVVRLSSLHFTKLMTNPDVAADFAHEVGWWHKRLCADTKAGTGRHQKPRPCPRCQRYSLVWTEGDDYVACQTPDCCRLMSLDEYDTYAEIWPGSAVMAKAS